MSILEKVANLIKEGKTDEANAALTSHLEGEVGGLKSKRDELLGDLKKEKAERLKMAERLEALESDKNKLDEEGLKKAGEFDKLREKIETRHKTEIEALKGENTKLSTQLKTHIIGEGLTSALVKAKVAAPLMDAAKALIEKSFQGEIGETDGKPFAKFDGKAVEEFVTGWAQSDMGKNFVQADSNTGGGSNGANGQRGASNGGAKTMTHEEFSKLSPAEKSKASIEGVKLT